MLDVSTLHGNIPCYNSGDSCAKQLSVLELPFDEQSDTIGHIVLKTSRVLRGAFSCLVVVFSSNALWLRQHLNEMLF